VFEVDLLADHAFQAIIAFGNARLMPEFVDLFAAGAGPPARARLPKNLVASPRLFTVDEWIRHTSRSGNGKRRDFN
jgi:hypothetical protein